MTRTLVAILALAMATPVVSIPVPADAQVLTGSAAAFVRAPGAAPPSPKLS